MDVAAQGGRTAVVAAADGKRWAVPYGVAQVLARVPSQCSLAEVEAMAARLLARSVAAGELAAGWTFEFDLAPSGAASPTIGNSASASR